MLGEAPGPRGTGANPIGLRLAKRLCGFAGWEPANVPQVDLLGREVDLYREALLERFELRNLLNHPVGRQKAKGSNFPWKEAREAAANLDLTDRVVVLLGKRVGAVVLGRVPFDYFVWKFPGFARAVVTIPHPSGVNRTLNDPLMVKRSGITLRQAVSMNGANRVID